MRKTVAAVLTLMFMLAALAPEILGCNRTRRGRYTSRAYYGQPYYGPYRTSGVAGDRYYRWNEGGGSTSRAVLTVAAPAAVGAGVGAIVGGAKGAGIGALLGGGGGAFYYLFRHQNHR